MKKFLAAILFFSVMGGVAFYLRPVEELDRSETAATHVVPKNSVNQRIAVPAKDFVADLQKPLKVEVKREEQTPKACTELWQHLASDDVSKFGQVSFPKPGKAVVLVGPMGLKDELQWQRTNGNCALNPNHSLSQATARFQADCREALDEKVGAPADSNVLIASAKCAAAIARYRFEVVDYSTRDQKLADIRDVSLLGAKLYAKSIQGEGKDLKGMVALTDRILELEPKNSAVAATSVEMKYISLNQPETGEDANALKSRFDDSIEKLEQVDPTSSTVVSAKIARARLSGSVEEMKELANSIPASETNGNLGTYYLAWAAYLDRDPEKTRQLLSNIAPNDPQAERAKLALNLLNENQTDMAGLSPFIDPLGNVMVRAGN